MTCIKYTTHVMYTTIHSVKMYTIKWFSVMLNEKEKEALNKQWTRSNQARMIEANGVVLLYGFCVSVCINTLYLKWATRWICFIVYIFVRPLVTLVLMHEPSPKKNPLPNLLAFESTKQFFSFICLTKHRFFSLSLFLCWIF